MNSLVVLYVHLFLSIMHNYNCAMSCMGHHACGVRSSGSPCWECKLVVDGVTKLKGAVGLLCTGSPCLWCKGACSRHVV